MNNPRVASIGTLAVDHFCFIPNLLIEDGKTMAKRYEVKPGGVAGNVISQLSALGIYASWFGKIGDDETGRLLIEDFKRQGASLSNVELVAGKHSMFTWITCDDHANRTIIMFPNVLVELTAQEVRSKHAGLIENAEVLMTEASVLPLPPVIEAMKIAREAGTKIVLDMDITPSELVRINGGSELIYQAMELTDVFIPCKAAAIELIGSRDIAHHLGDLQKRPGQIIAVTAGSKGCYIYEGKDTYNIAGYPVEVVESTGAGDAFHAGFVYGMLDGNMSLQEIGKFANACGAYCCTGVGARYNGTIEQIYTILGK
ncbi:MAG: carbohydrate kinase family protein [Sphaerochaeta sp.]|nr:carbohydrate kinase family protein [Sphaerochaeta sp.]